MIDDKIVLLQTKLSLALVEVHIHIYMHAYTGLLSQVSKLSRNSLSLSVLCACMRVDVRVSTYVYVCMYVCVMVCASTRNVQ